MGVTRRWWQLLAVAALLAGVGAMASMVQLRLSEVDLNAGEVVDEPDEPAPSRPDPASLEPREPLDLSVPAWIVWTVLGVAAVLIVALIFVFAGMAVRAGSRFRRRKVPRKAVTGAVTVNPDEVVAAVDAGLQELDESERDPRRAVIACWVRLERAAQAAGTPREPGDTPTDLVLRLLSGHQLSADVLSEFAEVYRLARYASRHQIDATMRDRVWAALTHLRAELAGAQV